MIKYIVPTSGYTVTFQHDLPTDITARTAIIQGMAQMTTSGDEFALVDGSLVFHCSEGSCIPKERRGEPVSPAGHRGLVVISGDEDQIMEDIRRLLTGDEAVSSSIDTAADSWLPPLPRTFSEVKPYPRLEEYVPGILEELLGPSEQDDFGGLLTNRYSSDFVLYVVIHIHRNQEQFKEHESVILPHWAGLKQKARQSNLLKGAVRSRRRRS